LGVNERKKGKGDRIVRMGDSGPSEEEAQVGAVGEFARRLAAHEEAGAVATGRARQDDRVARNAQRAALAQSQHRRRVLELVELGDPLLSRLLPPPTIVGRGANNKEDVQRFPRHFRWTESGELDNLVVMKQCYEQDGHNDRM